MIPESVFEVTRDEYIGFVEQLKPEAREVKVEQIDDRHVAAKIFSKKTGKCLCSRMAYNAPYGEPEPEVYYVFEMPDDDERKPPIPKRKITLTTKEEVQALFNYISQKQKEEKLKNG